MQSGLYPVWCEVNSALLGPPQQVRLAGDIAERQLHILTFPDKTGKKHKVTR